MTCFVFRLAFRLFGLCLVCSRCLCLWALAVISLGGLIIFRMLGAYVDSSPGTLIPALCVHYRRWTSLSLSALWSFIPAPPVGSSYVSISVPVGSSLSLKVVALPTICSNWCCSRCKTRFCTRRLHPRDQWERISVLHRGFIESSVVHTASQSLVLLRISDRRCRRRCLSFPALGLTCSF